MEKLIRTEIMKHLDTNEILSDNQYGVRPKRSTTLQLLRILDQWTEMIDNGDCFDVMYMDFSKAFDTVPHQRLIRKLAAYGINGKLLKWIEDFLSNRRQRVSVNGSLSHWLEVLSGIPQGSVLGPILFILYVNDLPGVVESIAMMFADDTKVYRPVNNQEDHTRLQSDLDNLLVWADKWQLQFNASKCKVMHYGKRNKDFAYTMNPDDPADKMEITTEEKDLGVTFSRDLKFSIHVAKAANKGNGVIGAIRRSFRLYGQKYADTTV
jgi:hypothetical protein